MMRWVRLRHSDRASCEMVDWVVGVRLARSFSRVLSSAWRAEMRALRILSSESALWVRC
jgi:hypothetical protein